MTADKGHLHHHLMRLGYGQRRAVLMIYGICMIMGMAAVIMSRDLYIESLILILTALLYIYVFLTDQNKMVELAGNYVTNVPLIYQGAAWNTPKPLYWNEGTYDVYAYYPYIPSITSVTDQPFSVATDQNDGLGFEASDLLWTAKKGIAASNGTVNLQFAHRLSRMQLQLVKSNDYEGELPDEAEVYIHNTVVDGTLDLNVGMVTCERHASAKTIKARSLGNHCYAAIVIPQRLNNRVPLVEVVSHGVSYLYESRFLFKPGVQHNVQLILSNNPDLIKIEVGGEIVDWN